VITVSDTKVWPPLEVEAHDSVSAMGLDPDLELLTAWREGDKQAAGELLERYYRRIRRVVVTKIPEQDVDDVVQRVIEGLLKNREQFRHDAMFKTYVMAVVRNTIADFFRKQRPTSPLEHSVHDYGVGLSTMLADKQHQRLLLEALRRLRLDDQILLELQFWEKMTGPELAQVFECKEATIRSRLRRARERLMEEVERLQDDRQELADTVTDLDGWAEQLREEIERLRGG
jgi:RNA polymerase sigma factor (sigma-70 family)